MKLKCNVVVLDFILIIVLKVFISSVEVKLIFLFFEGDCEMVFIWEFVFELFDLGCIIDIFSFGNLFIGCV